MQGRKDLRGTTLIYAQTRAFIPADIGAARHGLNVLARACSGAMFPRFPTPPFTLRGSLWMEMRGTLPFLACMFIIRFFPVIVNHFILLSPKKPILAVSGRI